MKKIFPLLLALSLSLLTPANPEPAPPPAGTRPIRVLWDRYTDTADGFKVYWRPQGTTTWRVAQMNGTGVTEIKLYGFDPALTWEFKVSAFRGTDEAFSEIVTFTFPR